MIPVDDSFLYVLPVYVEATSSGGVQIPELKRVIVVNGSGGDVSIDTSLQMALAAATSGTVQPPGGGNEPPTDGDRPSSRSRTCWTARCGTSKPPTRR